MKIIAQPCSAPESKHHYNETVVKKIGMERLELYLDENKLTELKEITHEESFHIWGIMSKGNSELNANKWKRINRGDIVIFYREKNFFSKGEVLYKVRNKDLANDLWGSQGEDTWEYIYIFNNLKDISISIIDFNRIMGYSENYILQVCSSRLKLLHQDRKMIK